MTGAALRDPVAVPEVHHRDVVLVTGPWLAGVTSVLHTLRDQIPGQAFVEAGDLARTDAPVAVVFVVSAAAVLTESDCLDFGQWAADTDLAIGVVSKIDVHRTWRDMLVADRDVLATRLPRYREMVWVGAAAAPDLGARRIDDLVAVLQERLDDADLRCRNKLRASESRLLVAVSRHRAETGGSGGQAAVADLQQRRSEVLRARRLSKTQHAMALRSQIQEARVELSYFARNRCAFLRAELHGDAAGMTRHDLPGFSDYARSRADDVVAEVNQAGTARLADIARELGLAVRTPALPVPPRLEVGGPPLKSRGLETRLMMLLGGGFGLGVALTLSRLLADLAPGLTAAGIAACVLVGLAATVWVVGTRGLLNDRAVLDRWVSEVTASLCSAVEALVATRVLAAESALTAARSERDEAQSVLLADQIGAIDSELREHGIATARAVAARDREMPALLRALDAVRAQLGTRTSGRAPTSVDTA